MSWYKVTPQHMSDSPIDATTSVPETKKDVDTFSYKGWLSSDRFWKRALAVYGYYLVGALMIAIPIVLAALAFGVSLGTLAGMAGDPSPSERPLGRPEMKIDIAMVCQDSLAYTTFPAGDDAAVEAYLSDCKAGKHPEVVDRYIESLSVPDGATI